jgi:hypothetical protein
LALRQIHPGYGGDGIERLTGGDGQSASPQSIDESRDRVRHRL